MSSRSVEHGVFDRLASELAAEEPVYVAGISSAIRPIEQMITDIAATDIPVLLVGESGTGKDTVASRIHRLSRRQRESFFKVSCSLINADNFGRALGAARNGNGSHGSAKIGTLFLDEISDLDAACQPKLLQALPDSAPADQDDPAPAPFGARVICSTRRNIEEEMRAGRFREELYFRLNGVYLRLPPLRQRKEDVPLLLEHFLRKYCRMFERQLSNLSAQTFQLIMEYNWPGNIRELENFVKKLVALGNEGIAVAELEEALAHARAAGNGGNELSLKQVARAASQSAERELILKALTRTRWNRKRAAQELQISYKALLYKLKQIGMQDMNAAPPQGSEVK